jgi:arabinogalactan endo-1,4-beta-galactosidase
MNKSKIYLFLIFTIASLMVRAQFYIGGDLSYVNEMIDCGAVYYDGEVEKSPFQILADHGSNVARFRLWHNPDWTSYSTLTDVKKSIKKAKDQGMAILLDFHYSDTWVDPGAQQIPKAWENVETVEVLADSVYNYTYKVLAELQSEGLLPEMVQIGNETNSNPMVKKASELSPLNWTRNKQLFGAGLNAVAAINTKFTTQVKTVIHIAQPEKAISWFASAKANNFPNFDIIGLSYYPGWSTMGVPETVAAVKTLKETHNKEVLIVEVGYPWIDGYKDNASNVLSKSNLLAVYGAASAEHQRDFLIDLTYGVKENGGMGVIYWEPAWVSTACSTRWGKGSHYENATLFDFDNRVHVGMDFLGYDYSQMPPTTPAQRVTFKVNMTGIDTTNGVFVTGDFTGVEWQFKRMKKTPDANIFSFDTLVAGKSSGAFIFYNQKGWSSAFVEKVPTSCAPKWDTHREYVVGDAAKTYFYAWSSCTSQPLEENLPKVLGAINQRNICIYPNPTTDVIHLSTTTELKNIHMLDATGRTIKVAILIDESGNSVLDLTHIKSGTYFLYFTENGIKSTHKIVKQ